MDILTDEFLAFLELKQDLFYDKIPKDEIPYFVRESLQFGSQKAHQLNFADVQQLYTDANIRIREETHNGVFFKVELRAQFESDRKGNHQVYLYQASIQKLAAANHLSADQMKDIVLAHEYFHYLEEQNQQHLSEMLASVETMKILSWTRTVKIRRASEIAANAFAKELLRLEHLPSYFDYQYLFKEKKLEYADLADDQQEYLEIFKK